MLSPSLADAPMLFEYVLDNLLRNRLLRGEEKIINNGIVAIPHRQGVGNELEACYRLKSLLKSFHDGRVVLFDKLPLGKQITLIAFDISGLPPGLISPKAIHALDAILWCILGAAPNCVP